MATHTCQLDHLVVTAPTLEAGVEWVEATLGVAPQFGGQHQRMGTHNAVLRLGETAYLEVIAPNPAAPPPGRPRWFELDRLTPDDAPKLATWVARTDDIGSTIAVCNADFGNIEPMTRGSLRWLITIPPNGGFVAAGAVPSLIEWLVDEHPAAKLENKGCSVMSLTIFHPARTWVQGVLACLGLDTAAVTHDLPVNERPYLVAEIDTTGGSRTIGAPPK